MSKSFTLSCFWSCVLLQLVEGDDKVDLGVVPLKTCNDKFRVLACSGTPQFPTVFSLSEDLELEAKLDTDCPYNRLEYTWWRDSDNLHDNRDKLVFDKNSLKPGLFTFRVELNVVDEKEPRFLTANCYVRVKRPGPMAIIEGGAERKIDAGYSLLMDGSRSIDVDKIPNEKGTMKYSWSCEVLSGKDNYLCHQNFESNSFTVPASYIHANNVFKFTLKIKSADAADWEDTATQIVRVSDANTELQIVCVSNCKPKIDPKKMSSFLVKCTKSCKDIATNFYNWTIKELPSFDYRTGTKYGRETDTFVINPDVLKPSTKYTIQVELAVRNGAAEQVFETYAQGIKIDLCGLSPTNGTVGVTTFSIGECRYSGLGKTFEVYGLKSDGTRVTIAKENSIERLRFKVGKEYAEVYIRIEDEYKHFEDYLFPLGLPGIPLQLKITCVSNCKPVSDVRRQTTLRVNCLKDCFFVKSTSYVWKIQDYPSMEYTVQTSADHLSETFTVKPLVFESGKNYTISVALKNQRLSRRTWTFIINAYTPIKVNFCDGVPSAGIARETLFSAKCKYEGAGVKFEVYTTRSGKRVVLASGPSLDSLRYKLEYGDTVRVLIEDKKGAKDSGPLFVAIDPPTKPYVPIKIKSCTTIPLVGTAMETKFTLLCSYKGFGVNFEVYTMKNNDEKVSLSIGPALNSLSFLLPQGLDAFIRIEDEKGESDEYKLNVKVNPSRKTGQVTAQTAKVKDLLSQNDIENAVQLANGIIEKVGRNKSADFKATKRELLQAFVEAPIKSNDDAKQIYHFVSRLVYDPNAESDAEQAEMATRVCKRGARINFRNFKHRFYTPKMALEIRKNARVLMKCAFTDTKPNLLARIMKRLKVVVTTPFPLLTIKVINEHYSDYDVDDTVAGKLNKYQRATDNYIDICKTNLNMMLLTVDNDDQSFVKTGDNVSVLVTKLSGSKLVKNDLNVLGMSFRASLDLQSVAETIDVLMCTWRKDIFWWNHERRNASTDIVLVKLKKQQRELQRFKQPFHVFLDVHQGVGDKLRFQEFEDKTMSVVRVDVKRSETFFVKFACKPRDEFKVLVTDFVKPDEDEVKSQGVTVNQNHNVLYQNHVHDYDSWHYVSIIPQQNLGSSFKYNISVFTTSCYAWNSTKTLWQFACKGESDSSILKIHCACDHLSIITGVLYNNNIKLDKIFAVFDFTILLNMSLIIFATTSTTFTLYCILLAVLVRVKLSKALNLYLPPDFSSSSRYVYLVGIRTGRNPLSGTSATICIQLFGHKSSSKRHVLNYPDPQKRIFQWGNEDWFAVLTDRHLGDDVRISLWSDVSGRSPKWYCSSVTVYDLQLSHKRNFTIDTWFNFPPRGRLFVEVDEKDAGKSKKNKKQEKPWATALLRVVPKRLHQADFSALIRLSLLESSFGTIGVVVLLLYGLPRLKPSDSISRNGDEYRVRPQIFINAIAASAVTFVVHVGFQWFLRNSGENKRFSVRAARVCQSLLFFNVVLSLSLLVIFGFWVPRATSWLWLSSVILALVFYFLVLENVHEIVTTISLKSTEDFKLVNSVDMVLDSIHSQRKYLLRTFGETVLRPYCGHLYHPMDVPAMKERNLRLELRYKMVALLEDTAMFFCYVTLLYLAIFAHKNALSVIHYNEVDALVIGKHTRTNFMITSIFEFYDYVNTTLIPILHGTQWYSKFVLKEPGMTIDFANKFLGVARLRQKRILEAACDLPSKYHVIKFNTCHPEFEDAKDDRRNYGPESSNISRLAHIWKHTRSKVSGYSIVSGQFGLYDGSGFVAPLGRTMYNSFVNLHYLYENHWIDNATSVVFIEFLLYNANANLFGAVRVYVERSASGYFLVHKELTSVQLLFVHNEENVAQLVIFVAFFVTVLLFTLRLVARFWKGRLWALKDLWTLVDLIIVGMSYACFVLYLHRAELVHQFLVKMEKVKKNEFINYFHLVREELLFTLIAALLVFVSTVRLWKMCRFGRVFRVMEKTLILCIVPMTSIVIYHLVLLTSYGFYTRMIFDTVSEDFRDVSNSWVSLMRLGTHLTKYFNLKTVLRYNPVIGNFFFTTYMLSNLFFTNFYIATISSCYHQAQRLQSGVHDYTNLKRFILKEIKYYKTSVRMGLAKLKGGTVKQKRFVTPKSDEFRYENCVTLPQSTLELMRCIAWYDFKRYEMGHNQKLQFMCRVAKSQGFGDTDIFYPNKVQQNLIKFIFDRKILRVARAAELILGYDEKRYERREQKYKTVVVQQLTQLDYVYEVLKTSWNILSHIDVNV